MVPISRDTKLNIIKCAQSLYGASVVLLGNICIQEQLENLMGYYLKIRRILLFYIYSFIVKSFFIF